MTTKERPILFSGEMVRAILDGRKSQTRRVVKGDWGLDREKTALEARKRQVACECPYGQPGDRLWVRETCIISPKFFDGVKSDSYTVFDRDGDGRICQYLASTPDTDAARDYKLKVTPSIHMPRWASRITLEITGVRVERLQDISEDDAVAEGRPRHTKPPESISTVEMFEISWNHLNEKRGYGWDANPWVWVIEFRRVEA